MEGQCADIQAAEIPFRLCDKNPRRERSLFIDSRAQRERSKVNVCCEPRRVKKKAARHANHFGPISDTCLRSVSALVYDFAGTRKKSNSGLVVAKEWLPLRAR